MTIPHTTPAALLAKALAYIEANSFGGADTFELIEEIRAASAPVAPTKMPIPPSLADPLDVVYAEGWNAACEAFFGGKPPADALVITVTVAAPVAPTLETEAVRWEFRWLNPARNPYSSPSEMAWKLVEPKGMQPLEAALSDLRAYRYAGKPCYEVRPLFAQAAPVAPAPQPAVLTADQKEYLDQAQTMLEDYAEILDRAGNNSTAKGAEASAHVIRGMLAAAPQADPTIKQNLIVAPAPLQQGEYLPLPEPLEIHWPDLNAHALGCGVEDRGMHDRYGCAEYGWQDGVDRAVECVPEEIYSAEQMHAYVDADRAARGAAQAAPAPVAEDAEIRKALHDAATSLETISRIAGKDQYMLGMMDVRLYAAARAKVAREAQAAQPEGGA